MHFTCSGGRKYYAASSSAPTSPAPAEGDEYYDTTENKLKVYNGTAWEDA